MIKFHTIDNKLFLTTSGIIKVGDLYLDNLTHPSLINYPLVMQGYCNKDKNIIQSSSGTTSPVASSRKIFLIISF